MKGEGRRNRSLVMEDYLQLAAGTLQEETVRLLCDGFRCEG